jgi:hypothetical protein
MPSVETEAHIHVLWINAELSRDEMSGFFERVRERGAT